MQLYGSLRTTPATLQSLHERLFPRVPPLVPLPVLVALGGEPLVLGGPGDAHEVPPREPLRLVVVQLLHVLRHLNLNTTRDGNT